MKKQEEATVVHECLRSMAAEIEGIRSYRRFAKQESVFMSEPI
jgi:hypothetical protein